MKTVSTPLMSCALALAVLTAPLAVNLLGHSSHGVALAAKGGNGGGNGHGGGPGNNGKGNAFGHDRQGQETRGNGKARSHSDNLGNSRGRITSTLGRLNAAHASTNARANASPHSAVGRVAAYEAAARVNAAVTTLNDPDSTQAQIDAARETLATLGLDPSSPPSPEEAATAEVEALAAAANKSIAPLGPDDDQDGNMVSDAIQGRVNALLGLDANQ